MSSHGELIGERELKAQLKKLEKLPQKIVTKAVRKAGRIVLKQAKYNAPYETGMLEKSIKLVGERSKTKGKKAYQITFDRNYNTILVKMYGENDSKRAYYPASQEYGFKSSKGSMSGKHFMLHAGDQTSNQAKQVIVDEMAKAIDKIV